MNRRTFVAAGAATLGALAGCLGGGGVEGENDGYPPESDDPPPEREFDDSHFRPYDVDGTEVTLASIEAVYNWYGRREARFADARGSRAYDNARILGAASSPVNTAVGDTPVGDWPTGDRIVCYCGCPHHLSSMRAATLQSQGYENVYVLDEGFFEWSDRQYPRAGSSVESSPAAWRIAGAVDPAHAGETAWVRHAPSGQREATKIEADGRFEMHARFYDVAATTPVRVETPDYTVEDSLGALAGRTVDG
jgi:rhodanese-related sulfurtransferase